MNCAEHEYMNISPPPPQLSSFLRPCLVNDNERSMFHKATGIGREAYPEPYTPLTRWLIRMVMILDLNTLKTSVALKFKILLWNLLTTNNRKSCTS